MEKTLEEIKAMNLFDKLLHITAELGTVAKSLTIEAGKSNTYQAVAERDILDAVKPLEIKYRVFSYPCQRVVLDSQLLNKTTQYGTTTQLMSRILTTYKFVNVDNPSETLTTDSVTEGLDSQDKGGGKAMTYGDKYSLMKTYKISTGDDLDDEGSTSGYICPAKTNREKLIIEIKKRGIDINQFSEEKGLTGQSTEADFGKALAELELLGGNNGGIF